MKNDFEFMTSCTCLFRSSRVIVITDGAEHPEKRGTYHTFRSIRFLSHIDFVFDSLLSDKALIDISLAVSFGVLALIPPHPLVEDGFHVWSSRWVQYT